MKAMPWLPPPFLSRIYRNASPLPCLITLFLQILKLYAWEPSFQTQVEDIRNEELKVMKKFAYLTSVSTFIFSCAPALVSAVKEPPRKPKAAGQQWWFWFLILSFPSQVSLVTFAVFVGVSEDNLLTSAKAFTSISLFNILRFPLAMLPQLIAAMVQVRVLQPIVHVWTGDLL